MAKEPPSIRIFIKDAFSGVGPFGWFFLLLKPANKAIEMLGEVDLFETYGGAIGRFFDTGMGTFVSIIIGATIIGYAIYKRTHDATDLQPSAPVVTAQPKMPEQRQVWAGPIAAIAKPETETAEKHLLPDQEKIRRAEILSKLRNKYPQRIIVDITPKFLMNLYKDKLTIEGDWAIAPYIGNWLLLSGPLDDVSGRTVMFGTEVTFEREFGEPFIHMYFDDL